MSLTVCDDVQQRAPNYIFLTSKRITLTYGHCYQRVIQSVQRTVLRDSLPAPTTLQSSAKWGEATFAFWRTLTRSVGEIQSRATIALAKLSRRVKHNYRELESCIKWTHRKPPSRPRSEVPEMVGEYTYFGLIPRANRNHEKQIRRRISVVYRLHSAGTKRNFNN